MKFDLDNFLQNHKPKEIESSLSVYLKCSKLNGYEILKHNNRDSLIKGRTYIRYIHIEESFSNKKYESHIKSGGVLIAGGKLIDGVFTSTLDSSRWTYLLLKYGKKNKDDETEEVIFHIPIKKNYIFFKTMMNNSFRNYLIELVENN